MLCTQLYYLVCGEGVEGGGDGRVGSGTDIKSLPCYQSAAKKIPKEKNNRK